MPHRVVVNSESFFDNTTIFIDIYGMVILGTRISLWIVHLLYYVRILHDKIEATHIVSKVSVILPLVCKRLKFSRSSLRS